MTDFDRHAIGSLEDFQRELSSLEQQRTQVEEKLKAFDTTGAGRDRGPAGAWRSGRGGGGSGRGVWGGRGGWGQGGREGERGERNGGQNGIRSRDTTPQDSQVSREKQLNMKAMWERGRDQDTAAEEYSNNNESELQQYRPGPRGGGDNSREADRGGRGGRETHNPRAINGRDASGVFRNGRDDATRLNSRHGPGGGVGVTARLAMGTRGRRQHDRDLEDGVVGSIGEPNLKRPRVASAVVVPGGGVGGTGGGYGGATARDDGELDRWNAGGGGGGEADPDQIEEDNTMAEATPVDNPASDEIHEGPEELGGNMQRFGGGSKIVVASSTARGRRSARGEPFSERPSERFRSVSGNAAASNRGGARGGVGLGSFASPSGSNSRRAGGVAVRGSLASRLGPVVGRPVVVVGVDKPAIGMGRGRRDKKEGRGGDEGRGEEGELVPGSDVSGVVVVPQPPPMVEPSKPELHAAYKDGDTKKRNRRMFGGLMAHLGRARERLEVDKNLIEKQQTLAETAAYRQREEKRLLRQKAAEAARQEREQELVKRDEIHAREQKALLALHSNAFIANQEQLKGWIFTKVTPRLAWRPNEHTDVTQRLMEASDKAIDDVISKRQKDDDAAFRNIDDDVVEKAEQRARRRSGREGGRDRNMNPYGEGGGRPGGKPWGPPADEEATKGNEKEHNGAAAVPAVQAMDVAEQANGDAGGEHDSGKEGPVDAAASSDNNNSNSDQGDEIVTANTNDRPDAGSQSPPGRYDDAQESPAFAVTNGDDQEDGAEDDTPEKEEMETGVKSNSKGRRAVGKSSAKFELKE